MTEVGDHQSLVASLKQAAYFDLFKVITDAKSTAAATTHDTLLPTDQLTFL